MGSGQAVTVFGAYGHTGRFVVAELRTRGFRPVLSGRDADKLKTLAYETGFDALDVRPATVDDPASLDRALAGSAAVVNCAGPFATTAAPVIEAALRAGVPYLDVAAEIEANIDTFAHFADRARDAHAVIVPAMAFFGGFGDLLATAAMGDWTSADEAHVAYGLSSWHPTTGTRTAGAVSRERRDGRRVRYSGGRLEHRHDAAPTLEWDFPAPMGRRAVVGEFTMADVVTLPSHLTIPEVRTYMTVEAARDIAAPETPTPAAVDEHGRSDQTFVVDVVVRSGATERRAVARGQDIYAVTAPLVVEAVDRVLTGRARTVGVASAGELFDAPDFLRALAPHITVELGR
ncbi:saccharopine dehydrogenase NADP-binding domain-containing protein [Streptomyces sp. NBC_00006]|uniref:saccharopine dehydrogenase family protein n=1 Tax=unclassified Streptomyces TaxID=2593676 RepID=UPI00225B45E5|nr:MULTISPECIES: saccharopine dehydrogenase NADP-binding domain-containing protein [unclassified Streptomyces]MCX4831621.1 saccharopine dehydrogenase NADP-binding domain-containing protein [Streptomyces sp. NBC_01016]MCX5536139.1 saccharopine dehydrogenase NADP-binding domain-containing protein [Streptomyces sp. NBC_00006]